MLADELLQIRLRNQLRRRMPDKFARLRRGYGGHGAGATRQAARLALGRRSRARAHAKSLRIFRRNEDRQSLARITRRRRTGQRSQLAVASVISITTILTCRRNRRIRVTILRRHW